MRKLALESCYTGATSITISVICGGTQNRGWNPHGSGTGTAGATEEIWFVLIDFLYQLDVCFSNSSSAGSWDDVFKVAVGLYIIGTLVWNLFSTGEKILE
jgi:hypothetical protein